MTKTGLGIVEVIGEKRDQILRLAARHGATTVRVFGSVRRGEARPDSDLDFLLNWDYTWISIWDSVGLTPLSQFNVRRARELR